MKKLYLIFLALALFANDEQEADYITTPLDNGLFLLVSLTPTNVVCKFPSYGNKYWISGVGVEKRILEYDEEFIMPLDQEVAFNWNDEIIYTPILLGNQKKGFRIIDSGHDLIDGWISIVRHVALSDPPVRVDESEVVMILEKGEWIPYVKPEPVSPSSEEHETPNAQKLTPNKFSDAPEDVTAPPASPSSRSRVWLWWLAFPVVAGAWLMFYLKRRCNKGA